MKLYTIGFTQKRAATFFELLRRNPELKILIISKALKGKDVKATAAAEPPKSRSYRTLCPATAASNRSRLFIASPR